MRQDQVILVQVPMGIGKTHLCSIMHHLLTSNCAIVVSSKHLVNQFFEMTLIEPNCIPVLTMADALNQVDKFD